MHLKKTLKSEENLNCGKCASDFNQIWILGLE